MKLLFNLSLPLLALLLGATLAFDEGAKFSPNPLKTIRDCISFALQKTYRITKCEAYYKNSEFYLDPNHKHKLRECAKSMSKVTEGSMPGIFYKIVQLENFTAEHRNLMTALNTEVMNYVDLIPQIKYFLGPKGKDSEIAKGLTPLYSNMALAASEQETLTMAYNQMFFDALNRTLVLDKANVQYLVLNGWHLRNMDKPPVLRPDFNQIYSAIVVWVQRSHSHLIGKNQVTGFLNGTFMPVLFDMPGSPDVSEAVALLMSPVILLMEILATVTAMRIWGM